MLGVLNSQSMSFVVILRVTAGL